MKKGKLRGFWGIIALAAVIGLTGCDSPANQGDDNPSIITYTVAQTGGEDGETNSTGIVFTFSASVDSLGLIAADITVSGKAAKDTAALTGSGKIRTLPITVNAAGTATVSIAKDGIETEIKNVTVYKAGQMVPETLTIAWHLNGGTEGAGAQHPTQIDKGDTLARPSPDPAKAGNTFDGWYADSGLTQAYDFEYPVTANLNLYAKWVIQIPVPGSTLVEKLAWVLNEDNIADGQTYAIEVSADEALTPHTLSYASRSNITIILRGSGGEKTVSLSSNGSLFTVDGDITLVLDNNITLRGHDNNNISLVKVNRGNLIMNTGSKISGNTSFSASSNFYAGMGGGVQIIDGNFTMTGGEISDNTAIGPSTTIYWDYAGGGGVWINKGSFTMTGGKISGNTVSVSSTTSKSLAYGGGVALEEARLYMTGGEISGNTAIGNGNSRAHGGGVIGRLHMTGGTISGNTASASSGEAYGGGVLNNETFYFTKKGGTIYGYSAGDTINSNVVKGNSGALVSDHGHAVYMDINPVKRRETTAGPSVNLDSSKSGAAGGWEN